jgi:hypothetical protein
MTKRELCNKLLEMCKDADLYTYRNLDRYDTEIFNKVLTILIDTLISLSDHYYDVEERVKREIHEDMSR